MVIEQADFRIEGYNLRQFKKNFEGLQDLIQFPDVYYESEDLLIENYIENAQNIHDFAQAHPHLNKKLAGMGLNSFFKMFIYDNFIHADCHAGNLLIQKKKKKKSKVSRVRQAYNSFENFVYYSFNKTYLSAYRFLLNNMKWESEKMKSLYLEYLDSQIISA